MKNVIRAVLLGLLLVAGYAGAATIGGAVRNDGLAVELTDERVPACAPGSFLAKVTLGDAKANACWAPAAQSVIILKDGQPVVEIPMTAVMTPEQFEAERLRINGQLEL